MCMDSCVTDWGSYACRQLTWTYESYIETVIGRNTRWTWLWKEWSICGEIWVFWANTRIFMYSCSPSLQQLSTSLSYFLVWNKKQSCPNSLTLGAHGSHLLSTLSCPVYPCFIHYQMIMVPHLVLSNCNIDCVLSNKEKLWSLIELVI